MGSNGRSSRCCSCNSSLPHLRCRSAGSVSARWPSCSQMQYPSLSDSVAMTLRSRSCAWTAGLSAMKVGVRCYSRPSCHACTR